MKLASVDDLQIVVWISCSPRNAVRVLQANQIAMSIGVKLRKTAIEIDDDA